MTVIDHTFFPHILDQIWSALCVNGLRTFRPVCRDWLIRADLCLSSHLVLEPVEDGDFRLRARCFTHPNVTEEITKEYLEGCQCIDTPLRTQQDDHV